MLYCLDMTEAIYLYGKNPLKEALLATKRKNVSHISKLFVTAQAEKDPSIMSLIQSNKLSYDVVTYQEIESLVGKTAIHQGVCALLDEKVLFTSLDEVMISAKDNTKNQLFVLLDNLQDPHNVGAIIRSAVAFGASAILIPDQRQAPITGTVIKSASGMTFAIPIVKIGNINTTLIKLKENGFWTYALTGDGDTTLHIAEFDTHTVLVVGGEEIGVPQKTLETCDFKLSITTNDLCESLNASNAAAVTMYEWNKQQSRL